MALTEEQLDHFHREGFVVVPKAVCGERMDQLRMALDRDVRRMISLHPRLRVRDFALSEPFEKLLAKVYFEHPGEATGIVDRLAWLAGGKCVYKDRAIFDFLTHPVLLDLVASLVGSEIVASSVFRIRPKLPGNRHDSVPWHQDAAYYSQSCDSSLIVTCWVPLVDATKENGCLWVLPRRNRSGIIRHVPIPDRPLLAIRDSSIAGKPQAGALEMEAGSVALLSNFTPHASAVNKSDHVRWSVDMRYQSPRVPNNLEINPEQLDSQRNAKFGCYPPEADFWVRRSGQDSSDAMFVEFVKRRKLFESARLSPFHRQFTR